MPETITCTECGVKLKVAALPAPGKKMRCPKCNGVFTPVQEAAAEDDFSNLGDDPPARPAPAKSAPARAAAAPAKSKPREEDDYDDAPKKRRGDDDDYDAAPKKRKGGRRAAGSFEFDGAAGDFLPVALVSFLLYAVTLGLAIPWVICKMKRWECEHTLVNGRRLRFDGTGGGALGLLLVSYLLIVITFGIYTFWAVPKIQKWVVENTAFADE